MGRTARSEGTRTAKTRGGRSGAHGAFNVHASASISIEIDPTHSNAHDEPAVLAAVETLYADELKPYSRILRKRLGERSGSSALVADVTRLKACCEASHLILIEEEEGGEWTAVLVDRPPCFIDVYSTWDPYTYDFWMAADSYFRNLHESEALLPGGRYACASALASRRLPFLYGLSLGRLCHFVQLAISQKKLLGYRSGAVVPYALSLSRVKDCCASQQAPVVAITGRGADAASNSEAAGQWPLATWEETHACLKEILSKTFSNGDAFVPLSNLKRLFRTECHLELSETALGHAKLSELLQDSRMADICHLKLQSFGYIILPPSLLTAFKPQVYYQNEHASVCLTLCHGVACDGIQAWPAQLCSGSSFGFGDSGILAQAPSAMDGSANAPFVFETNSPIDRFRQTDSTSALRQPNCGCAHQQLQSDENEIYIRAKTISIQSGLSALSPQALSSEGSVGRHVRNTFLHFACPISTRLLSPARRSRSTPKEMGSRKSNWESSCNALSYLHCTVQRHAGCIKLAETSTDCDTDHPSSRESSASDEEKSEGSDDSLCRRAFCSDEPLWTEEEECSSWLVRNTCVDWALQAQKLKSGRSPKPLVSPMSEHA